MQGRAIRQDVLASVAITRPYVIFERDSNSATSVTASVTFTATSRAINAGGNATVIGSLQGRGGGPASSQSGLREHRYALKAFVLFDSLEVRLPDGYHIGTGG
jgi:hypothetical protein